MPTLAIDYIPQDGLQNIVITSGSTIKESAFSGCTSLERITIPDSITAIGSSAFYGCASLKSIVIPESVTSIGCAAFGGCTSLESMTLPFIGDGDSNNYMGYVFGATSYNDTSSYMVSSLKTIVLTTGTSIPDYAFYKCKSVTSITIPDDVVTIGSRSFDGCVLLSSIVIPDTVTSIGTSAFLDCSRITSATMPALAISYIPKNSLQTVIITSGSTIKESAFSGCTSLESITISDSKQL